MIVYKHHIIPFHEWRRRINPCATRHDKKFNFLDNVVWLTLEQHIQAHQLLWELNNSEHDRIAYLALSGQSGKEEISRAVSSVNGLANKGIKRSEATRKLQSENANPACVGPTTEQKQKTSHRMLGNQYALGVKHTEKQNKEKSLRTTGRKHSDESRKLMSKRKLGNQNARN
jgi:hypothetical protein